MTDTQTVPGVVLTDVAQHAGALEHSVAVNPDNTSLNMALPVPANLAKFVGSTISLEMTFRFQPPAADGSVTGTVDVDVAGLPVDVAARALLTPTGGTTVAHYAGTLTVKIPLVGRKVELVFSPFDLETVEVRYQDRSYGQALPHTISRHAHPKARPEIPEPDSPTATGIDYLALTAAAHDEQLRRDERIGYHALYGDGDSHRGDESPGEIPGQLSIDDVVDLDHKGRRQA